MSEATAQAPTQVHVRWMIKSDLEAVVEIERTSFCNPWTLAQFDHFRHHPQKIGKVAFEPNSGRILGYVIYELCPHELAIHSLAVHPDYRRQRIATQLITSLGTRSSLEKRRVLIASVSERNLAAQFFFRKQGFRVVHTVPDQSTAAGQGDAVYIFQYRLWTAGLQQELLQARFPIKSSLN